VWQKYHQAALNLLKYANICSYFSTTLTRVGNALFSVGQLLQRLFFQCQKSFWSEFVCQAWKAEAQWLYFHLYGYRDFLLYASPSLERTTRLFILHSSFIFGALKSLVTNFYLFWILIFWYCWRIVCLFLQAQNQLHSVYLAMKVEEFLTWTTL